MGNYTFSLDDRTMARFRVKSRGEMSTILNKLLVNYLQIDNKIEQNVAKIREKLEKVRTQREELTAQETELAQNLEHVERQAQEQAQNQDTSEHRFMNEAREYVDFMRKQNKLIDIVLEAEKAGYTKDKLEEYFADKFKKQ